MAGRIGYYGGIVKDGLVLDLDAAKLDSYPRTGTIWNDISTNGNNGTLVNGPTFNSGNGGSIVFDGVDDYVNIDYNNNLDLPTARTTSVWVKLNTIKFSTMIGQAKTGGFNQRKWDVRYGASSSTDKYIIVVLGQGGPQMSFTTNSIYDLTSNWHNIAVTYDGAITTCTIYVNGVQAGQITNTFSSLYSSVANNDTTLGFNVGRRNEGSNPCNGNFSSFLVYNRALSTTEVLQNYNATKIRYGL